MRVNRTDGRCRECGGPLDVIDVSDVTMTVACADCCETYELETDALRDGSTTYWPEAVQEKLRREEDP